jgi:hypothetical protein
MLIALFLNLYTDFFIKNDAFELMGDDIYQPASVIPIMNFYQLFHMVNSLAPLMVLLFFF